MISIDGPAGAGKSTIARLLAQELGLVYVDTGSMYRALSWEALRRGVSPDNEADLLELLQSMNLQVLPGQGGHQRVRVMLNGEDITDNLRWPEVDAVVSRVARHRSIRQSLVQHQRELARFGGVVMDGRDIGTVVLPQADLKIFLTASLDERVKRRGGAKALSSSTGDAGLRQELDERDRQDLERSEGPLRPATDALIIDTTSLRPEKVVAEVVSAWQERVNK